MFCLGGFCPGGFWQGGFCPGVFVLGVFVQGFMSGGVFVLEPCLATITAVGCCAQRHTPKLALTWPRFLAIS